MQQQVYCTGCTANIEGKPLKVKIKGEYGGVGQFHDRLCLANYRARQRRGPRQVIMSFPLFLVMVVSLVALPIILILIGIICG